jgi:hypothetical protein
MKNARRIVLTAVSSLALVATVWATPQDMPKTRPDTTKQQSSAQPQSVSGKIASVEKDSFTLNVASSQTNASAQKSSQQPNTPKTMTFLIDRNTTVEGTLKVDSTAEVTYRQDSGTNVAISVRVTP